MSVLSPVTTKKTLAQGAVARSKRKTSVPGHDAGLLVPGAKAPVLELDPAVETLVHDILGQVAAKWTMIVLELLHENHTLRFSQIAKKVDGISQKMLTQTLRNMERDGLVLRQVHPVIPPHVDYSLTPMGESLSAAFCGVWIWAQTYHAEVQMARQRFAEKT